LTKKAYVDEIFYANEIAYVDDIQPLRERKRDTPVKQLTLTNKNT
jgi:hypothetical protein